MNNNFTEDFLNIFIEERVEDLAYLVEAYCEGHTDEEIKSFFTGCYMTLVSAVESLGKEDAVTYLAPLVQNCLDEHELPITILNVPDNGTHLFN